MNETTEYEKLEILELGGTIPKADFDEADLYQVEEWESYNDWPTYP